MSSISIERDHNIGIHELTQRIEKLMLEIKSELNVVYEWDSVDTLYFKRRGAKGCIEISHDTFKLTLNLGIMFRALRSSIEKKIVKAVDENLA